MMSGRFLILGYDALEYDLVERYDFRQLKQEEYGKVEINTGFLSTPTIWTSFITGLLPRVHGVVGFNWKEMDKLKRLSCLLQLNKIVERSSFLSKKMARIHPFLNPTYKGSFPIIRGNLPTIFDYAEKPVDVSVPCYSNMSKYEAMRPLLTQVIGNPVAEKKALKRIWEVFREKNKECLTKLTRDWDLFMVHFWLADFVQHLRWYREEEIKELYLELEETTRLFKERINEEETLILIISDHGQKKGLHTPYGFYSCNKRLNLKEPKITDFADIIRENLGVPTRQEVRKIKERLKELGY